ncbi:MAG: FtsQ-type POTRA domain-containing protein [Prochlorococcus marinus CUG1438]|nr:FtsQ-type POTRA domain-containing protein [Prochlorococcus marinus CUG1438]
MKNQKKINNTRFLFLILFLFSTSSIVLKTLKTVNIQDIRISGSELYSQNDVINNSSLKLPIRLISINPIYLERELKQNLSLKNVSVSRQILPFGLMIHLDARTPIAYGERILNEKKIVGFIDKDGIFINEQNAGNINLSKSTIQVFGWKEKFKKTLSDILIAQENYAFEIVKITFSPNGFLTIEERDLKTIYLGFNPKLIDYQLKIINKLKIEFKKNKLSEKIDSIDLTDPNKPKIKVFKP